MNNLPHPDDPEPPHPDNTDDTRTSGSPAGEATRTGAPGTPPRHAAGEMWGHLRIVDEIGAGAYGRVYRAWDATLARDVALKIIRTERSDPVAAAAVLREGQMLARVRHRNVVTVYGAQQIGREFGFWMELIRGKPLTRLIHENGAMGAEEAAVVGMTLCDALAAVHGAGLIHRDVKAQNVMRESGGRIVLMDFGAGRDLVVGEPHRPEIAGTPIYMSPHVLAGGPWSATSDIYSVGVLLFFLVTGRYPVDGRTVSDIALAHALGQQKMLADVRPGLPESFVRTVQRALESRYQTAGAMMRDLAEATPSAARPVVDERERSGGPGALERRSDAEAGSAAPAGSAHRLPLAAPAAGIIAAVWLLGLIASKAFDQTLERAAGFAQDSALDWLVVGIRSLIGPVIFMAAAVLVYQTGRGLLRAAGRRAAPLGRLASRGAVTSALIRARLGLANPATRAQWLLAAQIAALAGMAVIFRDLIWAFMSFLNSAPREALLQLDPRNDAQMVYRVGMSILVLVSAAGWYALLSSERTAVDTATGIAGLAVLVLSVVLLTVPYKLLHESSFRRVVHDGERCYVTGQRGEELLLFCPDIVPRNRIVQRNDAALELTSTFESIFTVEE